MLFQVIYEPGKNANQRACSSSTIETISTYCETW